MESKASRIILGTVAIILLAGIVVYFYLNNEKQYNWQEIYRYESKDPYGGYMASELLKDYNSPSAFAIEKKPLREWIDTKVENENYLFIGDELFLDSVSCNFLLSFVEQGNTAFIASKYVPENLMLKIYDDECDFWEGYYDYRAHKVHANFENEALKKDSGYAFEYAYKDQPVFYNWMCINGTYFCDSIQSFICLGYIDSSYANFMKVPHGKGNFLFHSTPSLFTNYFLKDSSGYEYVSGVMSYLDKGKIHWDEHSRIYWYNGSEGGKASPFEFILSQQALRWAWYTLLILVFIYVIFYAKRRQRIIPVILPNENSSLEFSKIVARLGFQQKQHQTICRQKMQVFMLFLRNRYRIKGSLHQITDEFLKTLSLKSGVSFEEVNAIFKKFSWIDNTALELTDKELIQFYNQLEFFYKTCK